MLNAIHDIFWSSWFNYTNFGCDIGGYRSGDRSAELLLRWTQFGAFLPLMENGGNNDHTPWGYETANSTFVTDIYRKFVAAHYELVPYLLTCGT